MHFYQYNYKKVRLGHCTISVVIVAYEPIYSHSYEINLPFEITFPLPGPDDKRTRGYSVGFIEEWQGSELSLVIVELSYFIILYFKRQARGLSS